MSFSGIWNFSSFSNTAVKNLYDLLASADSRFNKLLLTNSWNQSCPITVIHWDLCQKLQWRNGINKIHEFSVLLKSIKHFVEGEKSIFKVRKRLESKCISCSWNMQRKIYLRRRLLSFGIKTLVKMQLVFSFPDFIFRLLMQDQITVLVTSSLDYRTSMYHFCSLSCFTLQIALLVFLSDLVHQVWVN